MDASLPSLLIALVSVGALVGMVVSDSTTIDKSGFSLWGGFVAWLIAAASLDHELFELMEHPAVLDIFGVVMFLFAAMTIVEGVDHHGGFSVVTRFITATNKDKLVVVIALITFFLSAALDNLTTSIVMGSLVLVLMKQEENKLIFAGIVVAAANIGGIWSPIGNTTSILLWVGGQMSAGTMISTLFIPSFVSLSVLIVWFMFRLSGHVSKPDLQDFSVEEDSLSLPLQEKALILGLGLTSLMMAPFFKIVFHMQPWEGMVGGLVLYQLGTGVFHWWKGEGFQLHYNIKTVLKHVDTSTLYFFTGILMMVAANAEFGNLSLLATLLDEAVGSFLPPELAQWGITGIIGLVSGIIPNTPIVAAAQQMYADPTLYAPNSLFWQLLTYSSGAGGSLLVLGSAAGVVMMAIHPKLTFGKYASIMFLPSLLSFLAGFAAIYVQHVILYG